jgi:peptide/nickel transport system permease protein
MGTIRRTFRELVRYPSAIAGLLIILTLVIIAIVTFFAIPYSQAIAVWRGSEELLYKQPKNVPPSWINWFRREKLPLTLVLDSAEGDGEKTRTPTKSGERIIITFTFDYLYDQFPQALSLYFTANYQEKPLFASVYWITPDGREIRIGDYRIEYNTTVRFSQDEKLEKRLGGIPPEIGLLMVPESDPPEVLKGTYQIRIDGVSFEPGCELDAEFVMHGKVFGWAGTDHMRRDLGIALLWGIPIALSFGLIAALGTTILTMTIAAFGVWFNGWLDELIQRITEVNSVIPLLPILIMIGTFYSRSIWLILGVTILFGIFGLSIKSYRANFLQIKEAPYIEAARAYGASGVRLVTQYLIPRIIPLLIPGLVIAIPAYVFLEASLAVLGLGDPVLPTWGKIIDDANRNGALYQGFYYWILEPAVLLMLTGLAFALVGFALDRVFNPRLREL